MTDTLRDRIAAAIYSVQKPWDGFSFAELSEYTQSLYREQADAVIRELPELPVKISTQEQLDALSFLTVIREIRPLRKGIDYGGIYERRTSGWQCIAGTWVEPERNGLPMLPVMVLWRGKDEQ